jgi:hypothetical protein
MLTLGQFQNLIDEIDNTGNHGTTGQELINLFNAIMQDRYDYAQVPISAAQLNALGSGALEVFPGPSSPTTQYYDAKIILEFQAGSTPFTLTNVHSFLLGNSYLSKTAFTLTNAFSILHADTKGELLASASFSDNILVRNKIGVGNGIYLSLYSTGGSPTISSGNGTALAKIWFKTREKGSEL